MGIRKRVEDAELLWREGRAEGSLLMALITASATARRKYRSSKTAKALNGCCLMREMATEP
jgi:hypothetical protein